MSIKSKNKQKSQTHKTTPKEQQAPQLPEMLFFFLNQDDLTLFTLNLKAVFLLKYI